MIPTFASNDSLAGTVPFQAGGNLSDAQKAQVTTANIANFLGSPTASFQNQQLANSGVGFSQPENFAQPSTVSAPSAGGVLGANTGSSVASVYAQQQAAAQASQAAEEAAQREEQRGTINANFGELTSFLRNQQGALGNQSDQLAGLVGSQFGSNANTLESSLAQGQANIGQAREKVRLRGSETLRDLASNIRSAFDAGNIRLGVAGASDSSANPMMSYALARLQNQNRGDVLRQGNEQLGDLDFQEQTLQRDYETQLEGLKTERDNRLVEISLDFQNKINAINSELVNANLDRRQALTGLRTDIANEALQNIATLDSDITSFTQRMTQRANESLGQIESQRLSATASDFAPTTQLNLTPEQSRLELGPSAASLGDLSFFRPKSKEE